MDAEESQGDDRVIDEESEGDVEDESDDVDERDNDDESGLYVDNYDDNDDSEHEDSSEFDDDFEFKWLEAIDVQVTSTTKLDKYGMPLRVAYCEAKLIRRNRMRDDFSGEMNQLLDETSMLAFDLFNRYGRLRSEFITHPVIQGTGIWGQELDHGDLLLIETVFVDKSYRRQGLGRRMIESLLTLAREKTWSFFAFVQPSILRLHDLSLEWDSLQDDAARHEMEDREYNRALLFYRSLGFRRVGSTIWFAMASDNDHPSHQLASTEDFNPPRAPPTYLHPLLNSFSQIGDPPPSGIDRILNPQPREYPDFLGVLHNCLQEKGLADACWMSKDKDGNTVLHLAASIFNVACVNWILNQDFGTRLLEMRNNRGETPLELLQFKLEKLRTWEISSEVNGPVSDLFKGHSDSAVRCLILLKGLGSVESLIRLQGRDALLRIVGGCTCGRCLKGFLSPRMSLALQCQANIGCDIMNSDLDQWQGPDWVEYQSEYLGYLPSRVLNKLKTNKSMRQGFVNLWGHVGTCLERREVPDAPGVLEVVRSASEWPPDTRNFLQRGGTVQSVFLEICRRAIEQDKWAGDGHHEEVYHEDIANLPECRNDHEFEYVSGMCGYWRISARMNADMKGNPLDEDLNIID